MTKPDPFLSLSRRCEIHAEKMEGEGWYVTANVLWAAAQALKKQEGREQDENSNPGTRDHPDSDSPD